MIPYLAALEAFLLIFNSIPLAVRLYVCTILSVYFGINFVLWLAEKILG